MTESGRVQLGRVVLSCWLGLGSALAAAASEIPLFKLESRGISRALPAEGVIEAVQQATVAAQVAGRILELRVDAGQSVVKGQVLVRIDARESVEAIAAAKAAASAARSQFERTERLVAQKFLSALALDKARADLEVADAQVLAAQAAGSHALITAPISGQVALRHAELGEMAQPGRPLLTIYQPGALRLVVQVPQSRVSEVRAARRVQVEFADVAQSIDLKSFQVMPVVDAATHTAEVRIALPGSLSGVMPGMTGRARFVSEPAEKSTPQVAQQRAQQLSVPVAALVRRGEMAAVYVATERAGKTTFRLRQLRLGERLGRNATEVEVLAGLQAGEVVALDPVRAGIAAAGSQGQPSSAR